MKILSRHGLSMIETLTVIVILGIVVFITLPHLTNTKKSADDAAMRAKAIQLNAAKDAFISARGIDQAQNFWVTPSTYDSSFSNDDAGRYKLILPFLPPGTSTTAPTLSQFVIPGYVAAFSTATIAAPTLIYTDVNLDGVHQNSEPEFPYQ